MRICGRKENCFVKGENWGHLNGVMCCFVSEKKTESGNVCTCAITGEEVKLYTTAEEYKQLLKEAI